MKDNRAVETIFIATLVVVTLILGVVSNIEYHDGTVSSICFAISITCLVYWFLGGITDAGFNIGWLKLGGSIAALLGGFILINQQISKNYEFVSSTEEASVVLGKTSGQPQSLLLKHGKATIDSIKLISDNFWEDKKLTLTEGLQIKNEDFILGNLTREDLLDNKFYSIFTESHEDAEYFTMGLTDKEKSDRLKVTIKSRKFSEEGIYEFDIKLLDSQESHIETLKNKDIKIIKVGSKYFMIAGLQANFSGPDEEMYFQISIKPVELG